MRALLLILVVCLCASRALAEPRVGLLTMEPGDDMFERFGHAALRVQEPRGDFTFSYGAAPFNEPLFIWAFIRGEGDFFTLREPFASTMRRYRGNDRTVQYQELNLPPDRKQQLIARLYQTLRRPYNRYRYDQLYDNCATRLRDMIDGASDGALTRAAKHRTTKRRFRDYTLEAMSGHPIGHWGLDLVGGPHQDLPVNGYQEMYLPVHLRDRVAEAKLVMDGREQPLANGIEVLNTRKAPPALSQRLQAARVVQLCIAALLLLLAVLGAHALRGAVLRQLAVISVVVHGAWMSLYGLLVVPLTVLSRVHNFSPNENALLFWPTDLLLAPALVRALRSGQPLSRFARSYLAVRVCMWLSVILLKLFGVFTQHNATYLALSASFWLSAAWVARASLRSPPYPRAAPETKGGAVDHLP